MGPWGLFSMELPSVTMMSRSPSPSTSANCISVVNLSFALAITVFRQFGEAYQTMLLAGYDDVRQAVAVEIADGFAVAVEVAVNDPMTKAKGQRLRPRGLANRDGQRDDHGEAD
jgi:hypothetical protein